MNTNSLFESGTCRGTVCGTMLVIFLQLRWAQIGETVVLAAIGATVSFLVSFALKYLSRRFGNK